MTAGQHALHQAQMDSAIGVPVLAAVVVGLVGGHPSPAPLMWLDLSHADSAPLSRLAHALDIERAYLGTVLSFEDGEEPAYDGNRPFDLDALAAVLDLDRLLCLVVQLADGGIAAGRGYDAVEVTVLEAIRGQMSQFVDLLRGRGGFAVEGRC